MRQGVVWTAAGRPAAEVPRRPTTGVDDCKAPDRDATVRCRSLAIHHVVLRPDRRARHKRLLNEPVDGRVLASTWPSLNRWRRRAPVPGRRIGIMRLPSSRPTQFEPLSRTARTVAPSAGTYNGRLGCGGPCVTGMLRGPAGSGAQRSRIYRQFARPPPVRRRVRREATRGSGSGKPPGPRRSVAACPSGRRAIGTGELCGSVEQ